VLAAGLVGALLWLVNGPLLRVRSVAWAGTRYTTDDQVAAILEPLKGSSLLTLDDAAVAGRLASLPGVRAAQVEPTLPGGLSVQLQEKAAALVWQTSAARLLVAADGMVFGHVSRTTPMPGNLAALPLVDDRRAAALDIFVGDRIPDIERSMALRLAAINPLALGSKARGLLVRLDDACGYVLVPRGGASWAAAIGLSGTDQQSAVTASDIDAHVAAVRTLFAAHPESTVGWVDARNPGKVYWRANGPGGSDAC